MVVNSTFPVSTVSAMGCDALPENKVRVTDRIKYDLFEHSHSLHEGSYAATGAASVSVLEEGPAAKYAFKIQHGTTYTVEISIDIIKTMRIVLYTG
jgi:hypothetical protein